MSNINESLQRSVSSRRMFSVTNPQRQYDWEVNIDMLPGGSNLAFQARSIELPRREVGVKSRYFANRKYEVSTREDSAKTIDIEFWDSEGMQTYQTFSNWFNTVSKKVTDSGIEVVPSDYSKTVMITLFDSNGMARYQLNLHDAYPSVLSEVSLDYSSNDAALFTATMTFGEMTELAQDSNGILGIIRNPIGSVTDRIQNITGGIGGAASSITSNVGDFIGF